MSYRPPYTITDTMLKRVASIMEKLGRINDTTNLDKKPILRKNTKINSIHSSLAIENNSLSLEQVKDVIEGKIVIGPKREIQEVKNAYNAYNMIPDIDPYSIEDLLKVHEQMTFLIQPDAGSFRTNGEGVYDGNKLIFMCPPAKMVVPLIKDLFLYILNNKDNIHPLILSSIFHYEFVFIHPFSDGNGRMVRLWQNVLLYKWKPIFLYIPLESKIKEYQKEYYEAIYKCHKAGNSNLFIEFMLKMIDEVIDKIEDNTLDRQITTEILNTETLLNTMGEGVYSARELMEKLNIKSRDTLRNSYLKPALEKGLVGCTNPDKISSKNQKYYKI